MKVHLGKRGRYRSLLGVAVLVGVICFAGTAAARGTKSGALPILRVGTTYSYDQFWSNPGQYAAAGREGNFVEGFTFAPILHMKPDGTLAPALATKWRAFSTGRGSNKDFEFTLRQNAKFADGTPVDASAVIGWLNWFGANNTTYGALLGPKPKFTAVGKWTVRAALSVPTPSYFTILSDGSPTPWSFVASASCIASPTTAFLKQNCGAGPFMLDSSVKGDHYDYVPNPYYYDKKSIKWGGVSLKVIVVPTSLLQALQAGQLDIAAIGNDPSTASAAVSGGLKVYWASIGQMLLLLHAGGQPPSALTDVKVRQAMNYALDRKALDDAFFLGYSKPSSEYITLDGFDPKYQNYYAYNPTKAKALMAQAGKTSGVTLTAYWVNPQQLTQFQAMAKYLDAVGIHLDIQAQTPAAVQGGFNASPITIAQLAGDTTTIGYQRWMVPGNRTNITGNDPVASQLYYQGIKAKTPTASWQKFWQHATEQAYFLPIGSLPMLYYASKNLGGVNVSHARTGAIFVQELFPK